MAGRAHRKHRALLLVVVCEWVQQAPERGVQAPGAGQLVGVEQRLGGVLATWHPLVEGHQLVCT